MMNRTPVLIATLALALVTVGAAKPKPKVEKPEFQVCVRVDGLTRCSAKHFTEADALDIVAIIVQSGINAEYQVGAFKDDGQEKPVPAPERENPVNTEKL